MKKTLIYRKALRWVSIWSPRTTRLTQTWTECRFAFINISFHSKYSWQITPNRLRTQCTFSTTETTTKTEYIKFYCGGFVWLMTVHESWTVWSKNALHYQTHTVNTLLYRQNINPNGTLFDGISLGNGNFQHEMEFVRRSCVFYKYDVGKQKPQDFKQWSRE